MTPEEKYSDTKPSINHLNFFGSLAYLHVPKDNCKKLDSKTQPCLFVGYDDQSKVYRLFDPFRRKFVLNRGIVFNENRIEYHHLKRDNGVYEDPFPVIAAPGLEPKLDLGNCESQPNLRIDPDFLKNAYDIHDGDNPKLEPDHGA
jgi:hypothetical protein